MNRAERRNLMRKQGLSGPGYTRPAKKGRTLKSPDRISYSQKPHDDELRDPQFDNKGAIDHGKSLTFKKGKGSKGGQKSSPPGTLSADQGL